MGTDVHRCMTLDGREWRGEPNSSTLWGIGDVNRDSIGDEPVTWSPYAA